MRRDFFLIPARAFLLSILSSIFYSRYVSADDKLTKRFACFLFYGFLQLSTHFHRHRGFTVVQLNASNFVSVLKSSKFFSFGYFLASCGGDREKKIKTNTLCGLICSFRFFYEAIIAHISFHFTLKLIESEICFFFIFENEILNKQKRP